MLIACFATCWFHLDGNSNISVMSKPQYAWDGFHLLLISFIYVLCVCVSWYFTERNKYWWYGAKSTTTGTAIPAPEMLCNVYLVLCLVSSQNPCYYPHVALYALVALKYMDQRAGVEQFEMLWKSRFYDQFWPWNSKQAYPIKSDYACCLFPLTHACLCESDCIWPCLIITFTSYINIMDFFVNGLFGVCLCICNLFLLVCTFHALTFYYFFIIIE